MKKDNISVKGFKGTWYIIDEAYFSGKEVYLLEHEEFGDEAACIIINKELELILNNVWNGFDDLEEQVEKKELDFSTWRRDNGYKSKAQLYIDIVESPEEDEDAEETQDRAHDEQEELEQKFYDYCESYGFTAVMDED